MLWWELLMSLAFHWVLEISAIAISSIYKTSTVASGCSFVRLTSISQVSLIHQCMWSRGTTVPQHRFLQYLSFRSCSGQWDVSAAWDKRGN